MKNYLDDVLVWAIIIAVLAVVYFSLIKKRKKFSFLFAILLMLASVPLGIMVELSTSGCCGAPTGQTRGIGYVLMAVTFALGCYSAVRAVKSK